MITVISSFFENSVVLGIDKLTVITLSTNSDLSWVLFAKPLEWVSGNYRKFHCRNIGKSVKVEHIPMVPSNYERIFSNYG